MKASIAIFFLAIIAISAASKTFEGEEVTCQEQIMNFGMAIVSDVIDLVNQTKHITDIKWIFSRVTDYYNRIEAYVQVCM